MNHVYLLFTDIENGELTSGDVLQGINILPDRQYRNYYYLNGLINIEEYQIVDDQLVKKEAPAE